MSGLVDPMFPAKSAGQQRRSKGACQQIFTYATPHNGIELEIIGNVPGFFDINSVANFNRDRMCEYLGLPMNTGAGQHAERSLRS